MREGYVKTSPTFLRMVSRAFVFCSVVLLALSAWVPAPLQEPANLRRVPNPVKAAWFLIWVQELVSHSNYWIYPVLGLGAIFLLLPYLPWNPPAERARWCPGDQRFANVITLAAFLGILVLTGIALFFRGENWAFVSPF
jgi:hypothetical protein